MLSNGSITVINSVMDPATRMEVLSKATLPRAFYEERQGAAIESAGMRDVDAAKVYILLSWLGEADKTYVQPHAFTVPATQYSIVPDKSYLIRGSVPEDVSKMTITQLQRLYPAMHQVTTVDKRDFGSEHMHHLEVGAL